MERIKEKANEVLTALNKIIESYKLKSDLNIEEVDIFVGSPAETFIAGNIYIDTEIFTKSKKVERMSAFFTVGISNPKEKRPHVSYYTKWENGYIDISLLETLRSCIHTCTNMANSLLGVDTP